MTYSYSNECKTVKNIGNFWHLLFIWKASVYKIIWVDLCIFLFLYYTLSLTYHLILEGRAKEIFEEICYYCSAQMTFIPLSFVLGFYVTNVINRWEKLFNALPSSDAIAMLVAASIRGTDDHTRLLRRSIVRYVNASYIMLMMVICAPVRNRFLSFDHLVIAGILFETEKKALVEIYEKIPTYNIYWVPLMWAFNIVAQAYETNIIKDTQLSIQIYHALIEFRSKCGLLITYNWISIPLVYTQVVTWAVYSFFLAALFGRQVLEQDKQHPHQPIDFYFPLFTILQFLFYMGWLKVAETLVNPFGDDDDDFDINWMIDKNLQMAFGIVDEIYRHIPDVKKDCFWDKVIPDVLPYMQGIDVKLNSAPLVLDPNFPIHECISAKREGRPKKKLISSDKYKQVGFIFPVYDQIEQYWKTISFAKEIPRKSFFRRFHSKKRTEVKEDINDRQFRKLILQTNCELKDVISEENF